VADGVRKDEEFSGTKPVEERHRFDELRLEAWMRENIEGYEGPLVVRSSRAVSPTRHTGSTRPTVPT